MFAGWANVFSQSDPPLAASASSNAPQKTSQEASLKDNLTSSQKFRSLDGRFEVALTQSISRGFAALTPRRLGFNASGSSFDWRFQEGVANIMFYDYLSDPPAQTEEGRRDFFAGVSNGTLKTLNAKLIGEKPLKLNDENGWQIDFEVNNGIKGTRRTFLIGKRVYSLLIVFDSKIAGTETLVGQVFDSFKLISQADVDDIVRQQIVAATPPLLPQSPVVSRITSDVQDEGLKGKIKQIVKETEDLSGTFTAQGRHMSAIEDYNETGNRVKRVGYNGGKVFQITVYGYIDGKRVSKSNLIHDENGPPGIKAISSTTERAKITPDPRYEFSHTYKYLNNKLSEEKLIFNDGLPWLRYVYSFKGNEKTELIYSENGKLNQKYISVIDENGNEIEKTDYDVAAGVYGDRKYSYAYEFDPHGNWVKKTTFKVIAGSDKPIPCYITYRKIIYY